MAEVQAFVEELVVIHCGGCGVTWGMERSYYDRKREDHSGFCCPNGCNRIFSGQSEKERLKEQVTKLENDYVRAKNYIQEKNIQIDQLKYSLRAQKSAKTKIMNRVKNGNCPCCKRTFQNLQEHFKTQHPDLVTQVNPLHKKINSKTKK